MDENKTSTPENMQLCRIMIVFPVKDDVEAINCKKKIAESLVNIQNARMDFNITSMQGGKPLGSQI